MWACVIPSSPESRRNSPSDHEAHGSRHVVGDRLHLVDVTPHRGEPGLVGGIPATAEDQLVVGHHLDGDRPLVWIHPNHNPLLLLLLCHCLHLLIDTDMSGQEGTAA